MIHFGPPESSRLVWGQRAMFSPTVSPSDQIELRAALSPWVSMPGQTTGGIGFYRQTTGQPLNSFASGAYTFDTYITTYAYSSGQYSFALEIHLSLSEALSVSDAITPNVIYGVSLAEALSLAETDVTGSSLTSALSEALSVSDSYAFNVIYGVSLAEAVALSDAILSNAALTAYVINLNNGAVSVYNNFNFNSFAKIGDKYYGASDDGIFELAGADDAGTAIAASVALGTEDFEMEKVMSAEAMKRVDTAYLGVSTDGTVVLNVTANGATNSYTLTATTQTSVHTGRLMLGKGVASRYWDFELTNVDGADFTLESMTFYPVALTRRVVEN